MIADSKMEAPHDRFAASAPGPLALVLMGEAGDGGASGGAGSRLGNALAAWGSDWGDELRRWLLGLALAVVLVAVLVALILFARARVSPSEGSPPEASAAEAAAEAPPPAAIPAAPTPAVETPVASVAPAPVEAAAPASCEVAAPVPLPPLAESDAIAALELGACVSALAPEWLLEEDLLRRAAVALAEAAEGRVARTQLAFLGVSGPFRTVERDGVTHLDSASYRRFVRFVDIVTCVPPARVADLVRRFEPLLAEALAELDEADADVRRRVETVLEKVAAVPMPVGFVPLARSKVLYEYAAPVLEGRDQVDKQLMRMGPANLARLQDHAAAVLAELRRPVVPECPAGDGVP